MKFKLLKFLNIKKFVAVVTSLCFLFTMVSSQGIAAVIAPTSASIVNQNTFKSIENYLLPFSVGRITDALYTGGDEVVINIQDLHSHAQAQRNISNILNILDKKYGLKNVYVEGGIGQVDTSWLSSISDEKLKETILNNMLESGRLTGGEYYSVETNKNKLLLGIEDKTTYINNLKRLNEIYSKKQEILKYISFLKYTLNEISEKYYSKDNLKLNRVIEKHKAGNLTAEKYFTSLLETAQKANINLRKYPNIVAFLQVINKQEGLNTKKVNLAIAELLNELKTKLPYEQYQTLLAKISDKNKETEFYFDLYKVAKEKDLLQTNNYRTLTLFFEYLALNQSLNPVNLAMDEKNLLQELNIKLAQNQYEKDIYFLHNYIDYFSGYLTNKLTADEYDYFINNMAKFKLLWKKYVDINGIIEIDFYLNLFNDFYKDNVERNRFFIKNIIGQMPEQPKEGVRIKANLAHAQKVLDQLSKTKKVKVVITGGFHTYGFTKLLQDKNINYIVITPNVKQQTVSADVLYENIFKQQVAALYNTLQKMLVSQTGENAVLNYDVLGSIDNINTINLLLANVGSNYKVTKIEQTDDNINLILVNDKSEVKNISIEKSALNQEVENEVPAEYKKEFKVFSDIADIHKQIRENKREGLANTEIVLNLQNIERNIDNIEDENIRNQYKKQLNKIKEEISDQQNIDDYRMQQGTDEGKLTQQQIVQLKQDVKDINDFIINRQNLSNDKIKEIENKIKQAQEKISFGTAGHRGKMPADFNPYITFVIAVGSAREIKENNKLKNKVFISYDTRYMGKEYAQIMSLAFRSLDIDVDITDVPTATPSISNWAKENSIYGMTFNITASHNPPLYNGIKPNNSDGSPALPMVTEKIQTNAQKQDLINYIEQNTGKLRKENVIELEKQDNLNAVQRSHIENVKQIFASSLGVKVEDLNNVLQGLNIAVDFKNSALEPELINMFNFLGINLSGSINSGRDVIFGGKVNPEPNEANTEELKNKVKALSKTQQNVFGIATDPDGDRFNIYYVTKNGDVKFLSPDEAGMIVQKIFLENKYNKLKEYLETKPSEKNIIKWLQENNYRTVTVRSADTTSQIDRLAKYYADEMINLVVQNTNLTKEEVENEINVAIKITDIGFKNLAEAAKLTEKQGIVPLMLLESSGGLVSGLYDKDGLTATLLPLLLLKNAGSSVEEELNEIEKNINNSELLGRDAVVFENKEGLTADEQKQNFLNFASNLRYVYDNINELKNYDIKRISSYEIENGVEIEFENGDSLIVRASGTEPKIRVYTKVNATLENKVQLEKENDKLMALGKALVNNSGNGKYKEFTLENKVQNIFKDLFTDFEIREYAPVFFAKRDSGSMLLSPEINRYVADIVYKNKNSYDKSSDMWLYSNPKNLNEKDLKIIEYFLEQLPGFVVNYKGNREDLLNDILVVLQKQLKDGIYETSISEKQTETKELTGNAQIVNELKVYSSQTNNDKNRKLLNDQTRNNKLIREMSVGKNNKLQLDFSRTELDEETLELCNSLYDNLGISEKLATVDMDEDVKRLFFAMYVYYHKVKGINILSVLPYDNNSAYIPQNAAKILSDYITVLGQPGTNGQHSFYQLLHQGVVPSFNAFVGFANSTDEIMADKDKKTAHSKLLSNMIAQADAFFIGRNRQETNAIEKDKDLQPHKVFEGNTPSLVMMFENNDENAKKELSKIETAIAEIAKAVETEPVLKIETDKSVKGEHKGFTQTAKFKEIQNEKSASDKETVNQKNSKLTLKSNIKNSLINKYVELFKERKVFDNLKNIFNGVKVNATEGRAVLHSALRNVEFVDGKFVAKSAIEVDGKNVMSDVVNTLNKMTDFANELINGEWDIFDEMKNNENLKDDEDDRITVVSIGIGGSDLGPRGVTNILSDSKLKDSKVKEVRYVSNVDPQDLENQLKNLDPRKTLFIIESKTFTTDETMTNANAAKKWLLSNPDLNEDSIKNHFVAVSTAKEEVEKFGIDTNNMFEFWDWVGGRFSVWSAIGLPVMLSIGPKNFADFLKGANNTDEALKEVVNKPSIAQNNVSVLSAIAYIDRINHLGKQEQFINAPFDFFVDFIQQQSMESLGKFVTVDGKTVAYPTGNVIVPAENSKLGGINVAVGETSNDKYSSDDITTYIDMDELSPESLGELFATFEHVVEISAALWEINAFDQWGVQLGKELMPGVLSAIEGEQTEQAKNKLNLSSQKNVEFINNANANETSKTSFIDEIKNIPANIISKIKSTANKILIALDFIQTKTPITLKELSEEYYDDYNSHFEFNDEKPIYFRTQEAKTDILKTEDFEKNVIDSIKKMISNETNPSIFLTLSNASKLHRIYGLGVTSSIEDVKKDIALIEMAKVIVSWRGLKGISDIETVNDNLRKIIEKDEQLKKEFPASEYSLIDTRFNLGSDGNPVNKNIYDEENIIKDEAQLALKEVQNQLDEVKLQLQVLDRTSKRSKSVPGAGINENEIEEQIQELKQKKDELEAKIEELKNANAQLDLGLFSNIFAEKRTLRAVFAGIAESLILVPVTLLDTIQKALTGNLNNDEYVGYAGQLFLNAHGNRYKNNLNKKAMEIGLNRVEKATAIFTVAAAVATVFVAISLFLGSGDVAAHNLVNGLDIPSTISLTDVVRYIIFALFGSNIVSHSVWNAFNPRTALDLFSQKQGSEDYLLELKRITGSFNANGKKNYFENKFRETERKWQNEQEKNSVTTVDYIKYLMLEVLINEFKEGYDSDEIERIIFNAESVKKLEKLLTKIQNKDFDNIEGSEIDEVLSKLLKDIDETEKEIEHLNNLLKESENKSIRDKNDIADKKEQIKSLENKKEVLENIRKELRLYGIGISSLDLGFGKWASIIESPMLFISLFVPAFRENFIEMHNYSYKNNIKGAYKDFFTRKTTNGTERDKRADIQEVRYGVNFVSIFTFASSLFITTLVGIVLGNGALYNLINYILLFAGLSYPLSIAFHKIWNSFMDFLGTPESKLNLSENGTKIDGMYNELKNYNDNVYKLIQIINEEDNSKNKSLGEINYDERLFEISLYKMVSSNNALNAMLEAGNIEENQEAVSARINEIQRYADYLKWLIEKRDVSENLFKENSSKIKILFNINSLLQEANQLKTVSVKEYETKDIDEEQELEEIIDADNLGVYNININHLINIIDEENNDISIYEMTYDERVFRLNVARLKSFNKNIKEMLDSLERGEDVNIEDLKYLVKRINGEVESIKFSLEKRNITDNFLKNGSSSKTKILFNIKMLSLFPVEIVKYKDTSLDLGLFSDIFKNRPTLRAIFVGIVEFKDIITEPSEKFLQQHSAYRQADAELKENPNNEQARKVKSRMELGVNIVKYGTLVATCMAAVASVVLMGTDTSSVYVFGMSMVNSLVTLVLSGVGLHAGWNILEPGTKLDMFESSLLSALTSSGLQYYIDEDASEMVGLGYLSKAFEVYDFNKTGIFADYSDMIDSLSGLQGKGEDIRRILLDLDRNISVITGQIEYKDFLIVQEALEKLRALSWEKEGLKNPRKGINDFNQLKALISDDTYNSLPEYARDNVNDIFKKLAQKSITINSIGEKIDVVDNIINGQVYDINKAKQELQNILKIKFDKEPQKTKQSKQKISYTEQKLKPEGWTLRNKMMDFYSKNKFNSVIIDVALGQLADYANYSKSGFKNYEDMCNKIIKLIDSSENNFVIENIFEIFNTLSNNDISENEAIKQLNLLYSDIEKNKLQENVLLNILVDNGLNFNYNEDAKEIESLRILSMDFANYDFSKTDTFADFDDMLDGIKKLKASKVREILIPLYTIIDFDSNEQVENAIRRLKVLLNQQEEQTQYYNLDLGLFSNVFEKKRTLRAIFAGIAESLILVPVTLLDTIQKVLTGNLNNDEYVGYAGQLFLNAHGNRYKNNLNKKAMEIGLNRVEKATAIFTVAAAIVSLFAVMSGVPYSLTDIGAFLIASIFGSNAISHSVWNIFNPGAKLDAGLLDSNESVEDKIEAIKQDINNQIDNEILNFEEQKTKYEGVNQTDTDRTALMLINASIRHLETLRLQPNTTVEQFFKELDAIADYTEFNDNGIRKDLIKFDGDNLNKNIANKIKEEILLEMEANFLLDTFFFPPYISYTRDDINRYTTIIEIYNGSDRLSFINRQMKKIEDRKDTDIYKFLQQEMKFNSQLDLNLSDRIKKALENMWKNHAFDFGHFAGGEEVANAIRNQSKSKDYSTKIKAAFNNIEKYVKNNPNAESKDLLNKLISIKPNILNMYTALEEVNYSRLIYDLTKYNDTENNDEIFNYEWITAVLSGEYEQTIKTLIELNITEIKGDVDELYNSLANVEESGFMGIENTIELYKTSKDQDKELIKEALLNMQNSIDKRISDIEQRKQKADAETVEKLKGYKVQITQIIEFETIKDLINVYSNENASYIERENAREQLNEIKGTIDTKNINEKISKFKKQGFNISEEDLILQLNINTSDRVTVKSVNDDVKDSIDEFSNNLKNMIEEFYSNDTLNKKEGYQDYKNFIEKTIIPIYIESIIGSRIINYVDNQIASSNIKIKQYYDGVAREVKQIQEEWLEGKYNYGENKEELMAMLEIVDRGISKVEQGKDIYNLIEKDRKLKALIKARNDIRKIIATETMREILLDEVSDASLRKQIEKAKSKEELDLILANIAQTDQKTVENIVSRLDIKKSLIDIDGENLVGKTIGLVVDLNAPLDSSKTKVTDPTRIESTLRTIKYLTDRGANIVLMSHLGRPTDEKNIEKRYKDFNMEPVAKKFREFGIDVDFKKASSKETYSEYINRVDLSIDEKTQGKVVLLDNLRFDERYSDKETKSQMADQFINKLGLDGVVFDAFGVSHRDNFSREMIQKVNNKEIGAVSGFLVEKELNEFAKVENPKHPFVAILGGSKVSDKIGVIENLLDKMTAGDTIVIGGAMAYTFLKAQGIEIGKSLVEDDKLDLAIKLQKAAEEKGVNLLLPVDHIVTSGLDFGDVNNNEADKTEGINIPKDKMGADIGPKTVEKIESVLEKVGKSNGTIVWNGPSGVFEIPVFAEGTTNVAKAVAQATDNGAFSMIGGGDSVSAANKAGVSNRISHISTGGGASLNLLEGNSSPLIEVIPSKFQKEIDEVKNVIKQGILKTEIMKEILLDEVSDKKLKETIEQAKEQEELDKILYKIAETDQQLAEKIISRLDVKKSLFDIDSKQLKGNTLGLVLDLNVPVMNGQITDYTRIDSTLQTIKYLTDRGTKVVIMSHHGRPNGWDMSESLEIVKEGLEERAKELLGYELNVQFPKTSETTYEKYLDSDILKNTVKKMNDGDVVLLENLRFDNRYSADNKADMAEQFVKNLGLNGVVFDAFGVSHRDNFIREMIQKVNNKEIGAVSGFLVEKELSEFAKVENPKHPFVAILGGSKVSDKIGVIENLLDKMTAGDTIVIGGAMAYTFLKAQGYEIGSSLVENDKLDLANSLQQAAKKKGVRLLLPVDHIVASGLDFENEDNNKAEKNSDINIPKDKMGVDIGEKTRNEIRKVLENVGKNNGTIVWNGPSGVFEIPAFAEGTFAVARAVANATDNGAFSMIGGGDSVSAANQAGVSNRISHISTGGGASLNLLEGNSSPLIEVIPSKYQEQIDILKSGSKVKEEKTSEIKELAEVDETAKPEIKAEQLGNEDILKLVSKEDGTRKGYFEIKDEVNEELKSVNSSTTEQEKRLIALKIIYAAKLDLGFPLEECLKSEEAVIKRVIDGPGAIRLGRYDNRFSNFDVLKDKAIEEIGEYKPELTEENQIELQNVRDPKKINVVLRFNGNNLPSIKYVTSKDTEKSNFNKENAYYTNRNYKPVNIANYNNPEDINLLMENISKDISKIRGDIKDIKKNLDNDYQRLMPNERTGRDPDQKLKNIREKVNKEGYDKVKNSNLSTIEEVVLEIVRLETELEILEHIKDALEQKQNKTQEQKQATVKTEQEKQSADETILNKIDALNVSNDKKQEYKNVANELEKAGQLSLLNGYEGDALKELLESFANVETGVKEENGKVVPRSLSEYFKDFNRIAKEKEVTPQLQSASDVTTNIQSMNDDKFKNLSDKGIGEISKLGVVLVAGGMGERLGYFGIKIGLKFSSLFNRTYIGSYINYFDGLAEEYAQRTGERTEIPLTVMVSDSTHDKTVDLLNKMGYKKDNKQSDETVELEVYTMQDKKMGVRSVYIMTQKNVPAVKDGIFSIVDGKLETKPHGHGDVHLKMHTTGMAEKYKDMGKSKTLFIQDTNGSGMNFVLPSLGSMAENNKKLSIAGIYREDGEAVGALGKVKKGDNSFVGNVEYNILGDKKGYHSGNINQYILDTDEYEEILKTATMPEMTNPKPGKAARLETLMQDIFESFDPKDTEIINFVDKSTGFSPAKNGIAIIDTDDNGNKVVKFADKLSDTMITAEMDNYDAVRKLLESTGNVEFTGDKKDIEIVGMSFKEKTGRQIGAFVFLDKYGTPKGLSERIKGENKITQNSSVYFNGQVGLENATIDGAINIIAGDNVSITVKGNIKNDGYEIEPLSAEEMEEILIRRANQQNYDESDAEDLQNAIRGYKYNKKQEFGLNIDKPGNYEVVGEENGIVTVYKIAENGQRTEYQKYQLNAKGEYEKQTSSSKIVDAATAQTTGTVKTLNDLLQRLAVNAYSLFKEKPEIVAVVDEKDIKTIEEAKQLAKQGIKVNLVLIENKQNVVKETGEIATDSNGNLSFELIDKDTNNLNVYSYESVDGQNINILDNVLEKMGNINKAKKILYVSSELIEQGQNRTALNSAVMDNAILTYSESSISEAVVQGIVAYKNKDKALNTVVSSDSMIASYDVNERIDYEAEKATLDGQKISRVMIKVNNESDIEEAKEKAKAFNENGINDVMVVFVKADGTYDVLSEDSKVVSYEQARNMADSIDNVVVYIGSQEQDNLILTVDDMRKLIDKGAVLAIDADVINYMDSENTKANGITLLGIIKSMFEQSSPEAKKNRAINEGRNIVINNKIGNIKESDLIKDGKVIINDNFLALLEQLQIKVNTQEEQEAIALGIIQILELQKIDRDLIEDLRKNKANNVNELNELLEMLYVYKNLTGNSFADIKDTVTIETKAGETLTDTLNRLKQEAKSDNLSSSEKAAAIAGIIDILLSDQLSIIDNIEQLLNVNDVKDVQLILSAA